MSGITVIDADGDPQDFAEATTWHIDDRGQLHLNDEGGKQVASFAKDKWQGAGTSESGSLALTAHTVAVQAQNEVLSEIHDALRSIAAAVGA